MTSLGNDLYKSVRPFFVVPWIVGNAYFYSQENPYSFIVVIVVVFPYIIYFLPKNHLLLKLWEKIKMRLGKFSDIIMDVITFAAIVHLIYSYVPPLIKKILWKPTT